MRKPDVDDRALSACLTELLGTGEPFAYERTPDGVSTQVYRLRRSGITYYVRIAETADDSLVPEAELHTRLARSGVRVPEIVALTPYDAGLDRSVMVTTEVPGRPIDEHTPPAEIANVYRAAGRDLARIHGVPVEGFDFIAREHGGPAWPLRGSVPAYADYVDPPRAAALTTTGFTTDQTRQVEKLLTELVESGPVDGLGALAHGDFDTAHVFAVDGEYAGIIDFGEIRGAHQGFDLATMVLNIDGPHSRLAYEHLLDGYAEIRCLPDDYERHLYLACVLSTTHRLCTWIARGEQPAAGGWFQRWIARRLQELLVAGTVN